MALTLANQIALITKYSPDAFDEVYQRESMSSMLTMDKSLVRFSMDNARIVKIPKLQLGGLSDYTRNNVELGNPEGIQPHADASGNLVGQRGYGEAAAAWQWETREMTQDRGARYVIELFDNEESGEQIVGKTTTEANRTQLIPEIDAYTFATIAREAQRYGLGGYVDAAINASAPLAELNAAFLWLDNNEVPVENRIAFVSTAYFNALRSTPELYRRLDVEGAVDKKVSFKIVSYEGVNLVVVPPRRFNTGYEKNPHGGYYFSGGKAIDFIVMDKGAAVQVIKYQKLKVLSGEIALAASNMDGFVVYIRAYYDCFVFDNKAKGIYVHVGGFDSGATPAAALGNFNILGNADGIVTSVIESPSGVLTRVYMGTGTFTTSDLPSVGDAWETDLAKFVGIAEGTAFASAGTKYLVGVQGGRVVAVKTLTIGGDPSAHTATFTLADYQ